jgi:type I restriction enzyme S subunit
MITLTKYAKWYFILHSRQSTNLASISSSNLQELPVVFPPLEERGNILNYIKATTTKIDTLIEKTKTSIEKLKEYRTALISAAVTGKIDIRQEVI